MVRLGILVDRKRPVKDVVNVMPMKVGNGRAAPRCSEAIVDRDVAQKWLHPRDPMGPP